MAFKLKGYQAHGKSPMKKDGAWDKTKKYVKRKNEEAKKRGDSWHNLGSGAGSGESNKTHHKKLRDRYDEGGYVEPGDKKIFEKEDRKKAVDEYAGAAASGDSKETGKKLKKVAELADKGDKPKSKKT